MRRLTKPVLRVLVVIGMLASLLTTQFSTTASAAESTPPLRWGPVSLVDSSLQGSSTSTNGNLVAPCTWNSGGRNLTTYDSTGAVALSISRTSTVDGVQNCITRPAIDKNGAVYGVPYGKNSSNQYVFGANLLAYSGNTLKWKYPVAGGCGAPVIGPNGIIYVRTWPSGGPRLIGLTPEVQPGTSQPAKVFDIPVSTSCGSFRPYKDGIMVAPQKSQIGNQYPGNPEFYSYSGKFLGRSPVSIDQRDEDVNAEGQFFATQYTSGSFKSASVAMYDSRNGRVEWTTPVSTSGADVQLFELHALQGGGVVGQIRERKMAANGIPATPTEWVTTFVYVNASGQKVRTLTLPNTDAQGSPADIPLTAFDGVGKIAIQRDSRTTTSSGSTLSKVNLGVYDIVNGSWVHQSVLSGDPAAGSGVNSYLSYNRPILAADTVIFAATCSGGCGASVPRLYSALVSGVGMDYPRGVILTATTSAQPAPVPYVALGDSYSSGEGVEPFDADSNTSTNVCHRSTLSYSRQVSRDVGRASSLELGKFAACSGAKTDQVLNDNPVNGEQAQYKWLNTSTKAVSITIGGNDMGFTDFGEACVIPGRNCNFSSQAYANAVNNINNVIPSKLEETYRKLLDTATTAKVYVLGYPHVAPEKTAADPMDPRCAYLYDSGYDSTGTIPVYWQDAQAARDVVTKLNAKISSVVNSVRSSKSDYQRLQFVDVNGPGSLFVGHTVCAVPGESYFNNLDQWVGHPAYALHPNARGQQAYADILKGFGIL